MLKLLAIWEMQMKGIIRSRYMPTTIAKINIYIHILTIPNARKDAEQLDVIVLVKLYRFSGKQFGSGFFVCLVFVSK